MVHGEWEEQLLGLKTFFNNGGFSRGDEYDDTMRITLGYDCPMGKWGIIPLPFTFLFRFYHLLIVVIITRLIELKFNLIFYVQIYLDLQVDFGVNVIFNF